MPPACRLRFGEGRAKQREKRNGRRAAQDDTPGDREVMAIFGRTAGFRDVTIQFHRVPRTRE
jgi:hypothetical protein